MRGSRRAKGFCPGGGCRTSAKNGLFSCFWTIKTACPPFKNACTGILERRLFQNDQSPTDPGGTMRSWPGTKCLGHRHPKEPSRRVRSDSCRCTHLDSVIEVWSDQISDVRTEEIHVFRKGSLTSKSCSNIIGLRARLRSVLSYGTRFRRGRPPRLGEPDRTVPYGTVLSGDASQALRARLRSHRPSGTKNPPRGIDLKFSAYFPCTPWPKRRGETPFFPIASRPPKHKRTDNGNDYVIFR